MNNTYSLITEKEIETIDFAREQALDQYDNCSKDMCSTEHFLRFWSRAKEEYLIKMFGGKLIHKKKVSYSESVDDLTQKLIDSKEAMDFINKTKEVLFDYLVNNKDKYFSQKEYSLRALGDLLSNSSIIQNCYFGEPFYIISPKGRKIAVQKNSKTIKVLRKISEDFDIEGYEEFRLALSMVTNTKQLEGELCISIHPLDYITMSDNDSDWTSCMSWENLGCYCRGTIEMMNSPMVVVAYFESKDPYHLSGNNDVVWNNKKWRQLFIVNPEAIIAIKSYPYLNKNLTEEAAKFIKETCEENTEYRFNKSLVLKKVNFLDFCDGEYLFKIRTKTMYNDFGKDNTYHYTLISNDNVKTYDFNYSGEENCIACGDVGEFSSEDRLICTDCGAETVCDECGSVLDDDETYFVDGENLCCDCFDSYCGWDEITEEYHFLNNMLDVYFVKGEDFDSLDRIDLSYCPYLTTFGESTIYNLKNVLEYEGELEYTKVRNGYAINTANIYDIPEMEYYNSFGRSYTSDEVREYIDEGR